MMNSICFYHLPLYGKFYDAGYAIGHFIGEYFIFIAGAALLALVGILYFIARARNKRLKQY
ncbi:hypothetical protein RM553_12230 [Zunongwangia sp. F363]|uniref:Uncharacterized protein n=1 Tax=Autumnicola tepida TaxID=3075595 RepID=A0ABU3CBL7_9FLAO|nr:hypothetical protein [Zunongwangia sp. F363]MDT0643602.1 hypothetical protein [Zunongwangia sp. F363]